jgi:hypothetical protein
LKNLYGLSNQLVHCTLPIITIAVVGTSPLLNALFLWEIMYSIETLHKHAHNEWQMGCQRIMKLKFHKCHNRETYLILHITNHLHHSQLSHFDILKEASNQNVKCCHQMPHPSQRICVKGRGQTICYIWFHCQFEYAMLAFKVACIQEFMHLNHLPFKVYVLPKHKVALRKCLPKFTSQSSYSQY